MGEKLENRSAMSSELKSDAENGAWELVELPSEWNAVGCRWVFQLKRNAADEGTNSLKITMKPSLPLQAIRLFACCLL